MAVEDRALSDFPRALEVLSTALLMVSNPDGQGGYDTEAALLTEVGKAVLGVQYTQQLGNVSVFDAIKNCRVLSGTVTPTAQEGQDGQLYIKYETVSNVDSVVGMYFKLNGSWLEISTGGGGSASFIECTQAQYDAWEQAGTLVTDMMYFITDGQSGGGGSSHEWSSTEQIVGTWNGDTVYETTATFGALPSGSAVGAEYSLGITGVDKILDYSLVVSDGSNYINLPFYSSSTEYVITGYLEKKSDNSIVAVISVGTDRSSYTENKAIVRYTKVGV